jgi:ribosome-binding factor A
MVSDDRRKRLEDNVARVVAELLGSELKNPLPCIVTIQGVELTRDGGEARILYTLLGSESDRALVARRLRQVSSFVQREVSKRLRMRITPQVRFEFDDRAGKGARVLELLAELEKKEDGAGSKDPK